jgi:hypothetical protein
MEYRHVYKNVIIANYGGSKQVDNDDGSLFWRTYSNVMAYGAPALPLLRLWFPLLAPPPPPPLPNPAACRPTGWCQKFKCGGIESMDNIKLMVDLGGKFDVGCVTGAAGSPTGAVAVFAPNVWRNDVMVPLSLTGTFFYRQEWGSQGAHDWDKTQVSNITIYMGKPGIYAYVAAGRNRPTGTPMTDWVAKGNDPGSKQYNAWPSVGQMIGWSEAALGSW